MNKKSSAGFSLIELMVVILIIGILAAVAWPQYMAAVRKAHYAKLLPMAKAISDALEYHYDINRNYNVTLEDLHISLPEGGTFYWVPDYFASVWRNGDIICNIERQWGRFACIDMRARIGAGGTFRNSANTLKGVSLCFSLDTTFPTNLRETSNRVCKAMSNGNQMSFHSQIGNGETQYLQGWVVTKP